MAKNVVLYVSIPGEIDGTDDKFKVYLPSEFSIFEVKQYNPLTGKYDIPVNMKLIEGETLKYIRTNNIAKNPNTPHTLLLLTPECDVII